MNKGEDRNRSIFEDNSLLSNIGSLFFLESKPSQLQYHLSLSIFTNNFTLSFFRRSEKDYKVDILTTRILELITFNVNVGRHSSNHIKVNIN